MTFRATERLQLTGGEFPGDRALQRTRIAGRKGSQGLPLFPSQREVRRGFQTVPEGAVAAVPVQVFQWWGGEAVFQIERVAIQAPLFLHEPPASLDLLLGGRSRIPIPGGWARRLSPSRPRLCRVFREADTPLIVFLRRRAEKGPPMDSGAFRKGWYCPRLRGRAGCGLQSQKASPLPCRSWRRELAASVENLSRAPLGQ